MNKGFRLIISIIIFAGFAGLAAAHVHDDRIDIADFASHPEAFEGRAVEVSGKVIAINADSRSLELFDSQSGATIVVRLTQLRKTDRTRLLLGGARSVVVCGRANVSGGRLMIDAQRIEPMPLETKTKGSTPDTNVGGPR